MKNGTRRVCAQTHQIPHASLVLGTSHAPPGQNPEAVEHGKVTEDLSEAESELAADSELEVDQDNVARTSGRRLGRRNATAFTDEDFSDMVNR